MVRLPSEHRRHNILQKRNLSNTARDEFKLDRLRTENGSKCEKRWQLPEADVRQCPLPFALA